MLKIETICEKCEEQFILVTKNETIPSYCPYCSHPIDLDEDEDE